MAGSKTAHYSRNVFINCPFDDEYVPIFESIVFTVMACGFRPLSARQRLDSAEVRIDKIVSLIGNARYSIHDLSRTEIDATTSLPRFNMPLELGVDIGCRRFSKRHGDKTALILIGRPFQHQKFISDIAGQDPVAHRDDPLMAIRKVRDWLRAESAQGSMPGPKMIERKYEKFRLDLPAICDELGLEVADMTFVDLTFTIERWFEEIGT
ncbi:MAG: hypothetical protein KY459_04060 [Acidobacteria bacterium]|nr:hypothetical protein [Acidobacteriota bacterium]